MLHFHFAPSPTNYVPDASRVPDTVCAILAAVVWLFFQFSFSCPKLNSQVMAVFVKCGSSSLIKSPLQQVSVQGEASLFPGHQGNCARILQAGIVILVSKSQKEKSLEKGKRRRASTCEWLSDPSLQLETRKGEGSEP